MRIGCDNSSIYDALASGSTRPAALSSGGSRVSPSDPHQTLMKGLLQFALLLLLAAPVNSWSAGVTATSMPPGGQQSATSARAASDTVATLCQLVSCECSDPVMTSVEYPVNGPVLTGLPIVVKGCGFGNNQDWNQFEVWLTLKDYNNAEVDVPLTTVRVQDDTAVAIVPGRGDPNVPTGVMDQTACLQVFRKITHVTTNGPVGRWHATPCFSIGFQAMRDIELLPEADLAVQDGGSVSDIPEDEYGIPVCYRTLMRFGLGASRPGAPRDATFTGQCEYGPCFLCRDASGTDVYAVGPFSHVGADQPWRIINGWVFTQFIFDKSVIKDELEVRDPDPPYPDGQQSWTTHIYWWVTQNDTAWYVGRLYMIGPCGVPWRLGGPAVLPCM